MEPTRRERKWRRADVIGRILVNYNVAPDGLGCFYWKKIDVGNPCGRGYP